MEETTQTDGTSNEIKDPEAVLAALDRAKKDAKQFREEKEALEAKLAQYEQENAKYSGNLLREKVIKELSKSWVGNHDRLLKYLKFENLSFDDELNVVGLEDQIKELQKDFPELFDPKLLVGGKADSADVKAVDKPMSTSEKLAKIALGR